jgi:hypothetical protein
MLQLVKGRQEDSLGTASGVGTSSSSSSRELGKGGSAGYLVTQGNGRGGADGGALVLLGGLLTAHGSSCPRTFQGLLRKAEIQAAEGEKPLLQVRGCSLRY